MSPDKFLDSLLVGFPVEAILSIKQQHVARNITSHPIGASIGNVAGIARAHFLNLDTQAEAMLQSEAVVQGALNAKHTGGIDWGTGSDSPAFIRGPRYRVDFTAIERGIATVFETARQRQEALMAQALAEAVRDDDRRLIDSIIATANL